MINNDNWQGTTMNSNELTVTHLLCWTCPWKTDFWILNLEKYRTTLGSTAQHYCFCGQCLRKPFGYWTKSWIYMYSWLGPCLVRIVLSKSWKKYFWILDKTWTNYIKELLKCGEFQKTPCTSLTLDKSKRARHQSIPKKQTSTLRYRVVSYNTAQEVSTIFTFPLLCFVDTLVCQAQGRYKNHLGLSHTPQNAKMISFGKESHTPQNAKMISFGKEIKVLPLEWTFLKQNLCWTFMQSYYSNKVLFMWFAY